MSAVRNFVRYVKIQLRKKVMLFSNTPNTANIAMLVKNITAIEWMNVNTASFNHN